MLQIQMGGMEVDETVVIPEWLNELNDEDALCRNYEVFPLMN